MDNRNQSRNPRQRYCPPSGTLKKAKIHALWIATALFKNEMDTDEFLEIAKWVWNNSEKTQRMWMNG